jgi:hypothetical protein
MELAFYLVLGYSFVLVIRNTGTDFLISIIWFSQSLYMSGMLCVHLSEGDHFYFVFDHLVSGGN